MKPITTPPALVDRRPREREVLAQVDQVAAYAHEVFQDIAALQDHAQERACQIPEVPGLVREVAAFGRVLAEMLIRLQVLEYAMDEELRDRGRPSLHALDPIRPRSPVQAEIAELRARLDHLEAMQGG